MVRISRFAVGIRGLRFGTECVGLGTDGLWLGTALWVRTEVLWLGQKASIVVRN